jgi:hypothetical protein
MNPIEPIIKQKLSKAEKETLKAEKKMEKDIKNAEKDAAKEASKINNDSKFAYPTLTILARRGNKGEWLCCGVPCHIVTISEDNFSIRPFNKAGEYIVSIHQFNKYFKYNTRDENFIYSEFYPTPIPISEFEVVPISISKLCKHYESNKSFVTLLEKAEQDSYIGKGNTFCINIKDYNDYIEKQEKTKLQRVGDPIFNRASRHSVPIPSTFTREDFEKCASFPAPIGIRSEDFAFPSEQNEIMREMLTQAFNCVGAPECPIEFQKQLGIIVTPNSHSCDWCGVKIDINKLNL